MFDAVSRTQTVDIRVESIIHRYVELEVLRNVSLEVRHGEFLTLLGPSGSGKTTLLRLIGGLLDVQWGRILIGGRDVTRLPAGKRGIGFVFQNYALFPHLTVFENVAFPLRLRRIPRAEINRRVEAVLGLVSLTGLDHRLPSELSGGQQQRVALARAVVFEPAVLLMDEPLGSLDKRLRRQLQVEMRSFQRKLGITTVYVTHDQEEAFTMSDRIAVMNAGVILQVAEPSVIYRSPTNRFVADFVGDLNTWEGAFSHLSDSVGLLTAEAGIEVKVHTSGRSVRSGRATYGIRPERVRIKPNVGLSNRFPAIVRAIVFNGSRVMVQVELSASIRLVVELRADSVPELRVGDAVEVGWDTNDGFVFEA